MTSSNANCISGGPSLIWKWPLYKEETGKGEEKGTEGERMGGEEKEGK